jgi:hypothetical protein
MEKIGEKHWKVGEMVSFVKIVSHAVFFEQNCPF